jgi:hypothetical protein
MILWFGTSEQKLDLQMGMSLMVGRLLGEHSVSGLELQNSIWIAAQISHQVSVFTLQVAQQPTSGIIQAQVLRLGMCSPIDSVNKDLLQ